jgi:outer membrane receptor protein involved in Fe transport
MPTSSLGCRLYAAFVFVCLFTLVVSISAQTVTGTISGTVIDASGRVITGASVAALNERTGEARNVVTNEVGGFTFAALQPGTYTLRVEQRGFRQYERTGNVLPSSEHLSVGNIEMSVGAVNEAVTTRAEGAVVQTESSEHSALLTSKQLEMIAIRGRDVVSMLRVLPGVSQNVDTEFLGGNFGTGTPNIQGSRATWNSLQVDGLTGNDLGSPNTFSSPINLDAIGEVKVQLNNYQAEYGRNGGSFVNIITKSGSRDFHGSGYWYKRHEQFNANDFFNNRNKVSKPPYRFSTLGFTIGGPVWIPKVFNPSREKLFFFYSLEDTRVKNFQPVRQVTTPSQLERQGDFSQTLDQNGRLIVIRDPQTGQPFPNNVIPAARINRIGQALLNIFPVPNQLNRAITAGAFNYQIQEVINQPRRQHLLRTDWRPNAKDSLSVRGSTWWADSLGFAVAAGSANWGLIQQHYTFTDNGIVMNYTRIFSPTIINEATVGVRHSVEKGPPESDEELRRVIRSDRGLGALGQFFPANNPLGVIPQISSFGGVPNAALITYDGRFPLRGADTVINFTDNITYIHNTHTFKAGFFAERLRNYEGEQGTYGGSFDFSNDTNNPLNSGYAYANALLGNFRSYTESNTRPSNEGRKTSLAWFIQDNWKFNSRLTLDYGLRFVWYTQWSQDSGKAAAFALERYDRSKAPLLYLPACARVVASCAGADRRAIHPVTKEILPAVFIGAIIPGTGEPFNGSVLATDESYPSGFRDQVPVLVEPRFGFAYDIFGDSKTAIRGSFGVFHNTVSPGIRAFTQNPPVQFNPQLFYGNLDTFLTSTGVIFPTGNIQSFERRGISPSVYNYTLGIQRDIGFGTVVDVAYVGNVGRHLQVTRNLNIVPYGARFLPQNADPATPATPLNDNFFRPFPGFGSITYNEFSSTSNYNALQVAANRRFISGLQFGIAYTWSKTMNYADADGDSVATYRPVRIWNYGKAIGYDQTHIFVLNYTWDLPRASRLWSNPVVSAIFDNWQLSGITSFSSGLPNGISLTTSDGADITGGGDGARVVITGDPILSRGDRSIERWFNTSAFARPARGTFGNAPKDVFRRPGINNWDISFFKNIPIKGESRALQLRWEMYNAFNHTQFLDVDNTARFDASGVQTNARFGQVISTRLPRRMQGSIRLTF